MAQLFNIHYSPWSEKARWALALRGVPYESVEYVPMLTEVRLRLKLGSLRGKVTVPVLFANGNVVRDSFDIAKWADEQGSGPSLFPQGADAELRRWNEQSEVALCAGRANTTLRASTNEAAKRESLPPFIQPLGPVARAMGSMGVRYLVDKYGLNENTEKENRKKMRGVLETLSQALRGQDYLLGEFSYADVVMAVGLQFVRPVADKFIRLGPAARQVWTDPELPAEHPDLIEWRDRIYERHR